MIRKVRYIDFSQKIIMDKFLLASKFIFSFVISCLVIFNLNNANGAEANSLQSDIDQSHINNEIDYSINKSLGDYIQTAQNSSKIKSQKVAAVADPGYYKAQWDPIHFSPLIEKATDEQCLECHTEVLERNVRVKSIAGVDADLSVAWYQMLDTYSGDQQTFHQRHISSEFSKQVMDLKCNFCHQGNDPREEVHGSDVMGMARGNFAMRKMVNPEDSCLRCHGSFPGEEIMLGLSGDNWEENKEMFEFDDVKNGCLSCHEELYRTVRHQVSYLKADKIEELAKDSSDVCYGCHGGRKWYRISYPYPRTPWPDMDPEDIPEWSVDRASQSEEKYRLK